MKCLSVSRNVTATVLVLLLVAASAPAALALPAGPAGGGGAAWDVQAFFDWMQDLFAGFFGGGPGEEEGPSQLTEKQRADSVADGSDLKATSTGTSTSLPLQEEVLGR
jgi:hypothetical protein